MPLAPREVDAIFSACDVTACLSNLLTETNHRPTKHHPAYTQPYITTQNYTTTTPTRPPTHQPCYQVDGNGSIDWTELRRRSGRRCRSRRSGKGTSGKAAEAIQASSKRARAQANARGAGGGEWRSLANTDNVEFR